MRKQDYLIALLFLTSPIIVNKVFANNVIDLLDFPSISSHLVAKSVLISAAQSNNTVFTVGERGHIITWENENTWQQHEVPVSVSLTGITILSDGSKVAVGHDSVILRSDTDSTQWHKVFTGYDLIKLNLLLLHKQKMLLAETITNTVDENEREELNAQLEELSFAIEDSEVEQKTGPTKPLLSIARTSQDILFAAGAYGTLLTSTDKGRTWALISDRIDNINKFHLNSIISTQDDQLYIVGENGLAFHSSDLGITWSVMQMPYAGSLFGIIAAPDSAQLIAFGLQGNLMVSINSGSRWQHQKLLTSASLLGGTFSQLGHAYIVGHGGLIIEVNVNDLSSIQVRKHPSGATLSSVLIKDNELVLAGQLGITSFPLHTQTK